MRSSTPRPPRHPTPVRCLAAEQAIHAKKEAIRAEVLYAEAEADAMEVANAVAAADAQTEQEADAAAHRLAAQLQAKEEEHTKQVAQEADAQAHALAKATRDDDVEAQARLLTEFSRKRSRETAASVDAIQLKQLVRKVLEEHGLDFGVKGVRQ